MARWEIVTGSGSPVSYKWGWRLSHESLWHNAEMTYSRILLLTGLQCAAFALGPLPFVFETNRGQASAEVQMFGRQGSATLMLTEDEVLLRTPTTLFRTRFEGHSKNLRAEGLDASGGVTNYFLGKSVVQAPHYARARYPNVYPGIDAVFYEKNGHLEYDLVVAPGADPDRVRLSFPGAESVKLDSTGGLVIGIAGGEVRQARPVAYQMIDGKRVEAESNFTLENRLVKFAVGRYDRRAALIIDPTVVYSTVLGGNSLVAVRGIGVDAAGNLYAAGATDATNLPVTAGALPTPTAAGRSYVAKLNPSGSAIVYLTYLGGNEETTRIGAMAVDSAGNAYLTGITRAGDFPVTPGSAQTTHRSAAATVPSDRDDAFVTKLSPEGSLIYSTFLGGERAEGGEGIAVDASGNAYIGGMTTSRTFVISPGAFQSAHAAGGFDAFIVKVNAAGSAFVYGTFLGGSGDDEVRGIAVDNFGVVTAVGDGPSKDFPTTPGALQSTAGAFYNGFFVRLNVSGTALLYSTYLGSNGSDVMRGVALDVSGAAYITGETDSADFLTTPGAFQRSLRSGAANRIFVMKFSAANTLVYSTFVGGSVGEVPRSIAVDRNGNAVVVGLTDSSDFPTATPRQFFSGLGDGFLFKLNAGGSALLDSTFLGGASVAFATSVKVDSADAVYVAGLTSLRGFPLSASPLPGVPQGGRDGFFTKYTYPATPPPVALQAMVNAASFIGGPIAPGEVVTLFGTPIGPANLTTLQLENGNVSTALAGTRVRFDDVEAPIIYASSGQTSVVVPYSVAGKSFVEVVAEYQGQLSQTVRATVVPANPAFFTANSSGSGQGAILNQNGSINSRSNPAAAQSVVVLYGTGGGLVTPQAVTGGLASGIANQNLAVSVEFSTGAGRRAGEVLYAGSAPGLVNGVLQVNVKLPAGVTGTVPLRVRVGTVVSPDVNVEVGLN